MSEMRVRELALRLERDAQILAAYTRRPVHLIHQQLIRNYLTARRRDS